MLTVVWAPWGYLSDLYVTRSGNFNGYLNCLFPLVYPSSGILTPLYGTAQLQRRTRLQLFLE